MTCNCGRNDGWHLPHCRALTAAVLEGRIDGTHWVYRERQ